MFDDIINNILSKKEQVPKEQVPNKHKFINMKPKKQFLVAGKPVQVFNNNPIPNIKTIKNVYKKIPDDTRIPLQFMTRKQYLKTYIKNQELSKNIDFSKHEENAYLKQQSKEYDNIIGRYTTKHNPYYPPAVVMFNDKSNVRNIKGEKFQKTALHEFGHELVEQKGLKMSFEKEERFADSVADYGMRYNKKINADSVSKDKIIFPKHIPLSEDKKELAVKRIQEQYKYEPFALDRFDFILTDEPTHKERDAVYFDIVPKNVPYPKIHKKALSEEELKKAAREHAIEYYGKETVEKFEQEDKDFALKRFNRELKNVERLGYEHHKKSDDLVSNPGIIYRGMSEYELDAAKRNKKFKSKGKYNIGEDQENVTYGTPSIDKASSYASGFAVGAYKPFIDKTGYIIGFEKDDDWIDYTPGNKKLIGENESINEKDISLNKIKEIYRFEPTNIKLGDISLTDNWGKPLDVVMFNGPQSEGRWKTDDNITEPNYNIPKNDNVSKDKIYFHGTRKQNIESIKNKGLIPNFGRTSEYSKKGKVYVTPSEQYAALYAQESFSSPIVLKVDIDANIDDTREYDGIITPDKILGYREVSKDFIDVYNETEQKEWKILKDTDSKNDTKEKQIMKGRHWTVTQKLHPMQSQLIHQAKESDNLRDFWKRSAYGRPVHLTRDKEFKLDATKGSRDMSTMSDSKPEPGTIMFTNDLSAWDAFYNDYGYDWKSKKDRYEHSKEQDLVRPYVAVLDLSNAKLANSLEDEGDYWDVKRGFGDEHYVRDVTKISVAELNPIEKERRKTQEYSAKFAPDNENELKLFYALARDENLEDVNKQSVIKTQEEYDAEHKKYSETKNWAGAALKQNIEKDTDSKDMMVYHGTTPMASTQIKTQGILTSKEIKDNGSPYFELSNKTNPSRTYFFDTKEKAAMWSKLATENSMFPQGIPKVIEVDVPDNELFPDLEMPIPGAFYKHGHVKPSQIKGIYDVTEEDLSVISQNLENNQNNQE